MKTNMTLHNGRDGTEVNFDDKFPFCEYTISTFNQENSWTFKPDKSIGNTVEDKIQLKRDHKKEVE